MAIPNEIIDSIQQKTDIIEVLSGYLTLKKAGRNYRALCPFHHEKTPSFMVNPDKQIFHCFGCGAGGNVFGFLMKHEGMDFPEAVRFLAKKAGVSVPAFSEGTKRDQTFAEELYLLNESAAEYYQSCLVKDKGALDYLHSRGIGNDMMKKFRIGLAPDSWDGLITYFRKRNVAETALEKAGLAIRKENGSCYDRFRNRVIFPIFDMRGRVVGFGARVRDESLPKYINSPETAVYSKGKHLYGLTFSKDAIREKKHALLVEGYLDLIIPFQTGAQNIVATLGTALTNEQIRLLKRFTKTVVMVYDPDEAGESAAMRNLDLFLDEGMSVYVATLTVGYDPDSFIRKFGLESFNEMVKSAKNIFDYKLEQLSARYNVRDMNGKVAIAGEMLPTIARIENAVLKSTLIKKLADFLSVDEESLKTELKKVKRDTAGRQPFESMKTTTTTTRVLRHAERILLSLMLEERRFIDKVREHLSPDMFTDESVRKIVSLVWRLSGEDSAVTVSRLMNHLEPNGEASAIVSEAAALNDMIADKDRAFTDCIERIKAERVQTELSRLQAEIKDAHHAKDDPRLRNLIIAYNNLVKSRVCQTSR